MDLLALFSGKQVTGEEGESFPSFAAENAFNQSYAGNRTLCRPLGTRAKRDCYQNLLNPLSANENGLQRCRLVEISLFPATLLH